MSISFNRVKPGDLIRAQDFVDLADAIIALDGRISALEVGGEKPVILDVRPAQLTPLGVMEIVGRNFAVPSTFNTIHLDGQELSGVLFGSAELLKVTVPGDLQGLPRDMLLEVETAKGKASRTVHVQDSGVTIGGAPVITAATATNPGAITAGKTYTFLFKVDANSVTDRETYQLKAVYTDVVGATVQEWEGATRFVGAAGDRIEVDPAEPVTVGVTVTVPGGATSVSLALRAISIHNDPGSSASSAEEELVVGEEPFTGDESISISIPEGDLPANLTTALDGATTVYRVKFPAVGTATRRVKLPVLVTMVEAGKYTYTAEIRNAGSTWAVSAVEPAESQEPANGTADLAVPVTIKTNGPAAERRKLVITVTREGAADGVGSNRVIVPIEGNAG